MVAVGTSGLVVRTDDGGQSWLRVHTPTGSDLSSVTGAGEVWLAAGHGGTLLRSDDGGLGWSEVGPRPRSDLRGVALRDDGEAIVVGLGGTVLRSRDFGRSWETGPALEGRTFEAAAVDADGRFLALSLEGELFTLDGASWARRAIPGRSPRALCVRGARVAVGDGRGAVHLSDDGGTSWTSLPTGTGNALLDVWLGPADQIVVAGFDGTLASSADGGGSWTRHPTRRRDTLRALFGSDDGQVWCVGAEALRSPDGGRSFEPVFITTKKAKVEGPWRHVRLQGRGFRNLCALGEGQLLLVGDDGRIATTTDSGETWRLKAVKSRGDLSRAWGKGQTLFAAGAGSKLFCSPDGGRTWKDLNAGKGPSDLDENGPLRAFKLQGDAVFRAGPRGWMQQSLPGDVELSAVWAGPGSLAVAVGKAGAVMRTKDDGATWEKVTSGVDMDLHFVWGRGEEVYALHSDSPLSTPLRSRDAGASWEALPDIPGRVEGLWGDASGTLWVCGAEGLLMRSTDQGESWQGEVSGTDNDLRALHGFGDEVWALSDHNFLLRRQPLGSL